MALANCSHCGKQTEVELRQSINTALDPQLKSRVRDGSLFIWECPYCGRRSVAVSETLYHDPDGKTDGVASSRRQSSPRRPAGGRKGAGGLYPPPGAGGGETHRKGKYPRCRPGRHRHGNVQVGDPAGNYRPKNPERPPPASVSFARKGPTTTWCWRSPLPARCRC